MIGQLIFAVCFAVALFLFSKNAQQIYRNIKLGRPADRSDKPAERWKMMLLVAFGQKKMFKRIFPAVLHLFVYLGFVIINIEMLEIVIDGLFGTHRIFSFLGSFYNFLIGAFEWLALGVLVSCVIFLIRRNIAKVARLNSVELKHWPKTDANIILITEILLMSAFLLMNASDLKLQLYGFEHFKSVGSFPVSHYLLPYLPTSTEALFLIERSCWWFHILGVLAFLNYLPYSKHLHIILAFPNTYFSNLNAKGKLSNMPAVTNEVKAMLDPSFTPPAADANARFGAKDVQDLTWKSLLDAYTCTECGRCTSSCPANMTGKLLSPRKIMMDTRDRLTEVGTNIKTNGSFQDDGKSLIDTYISREELWACTSCNACVEQCPVNINPLDIIIELRRFAVMEESQAPASINNMFGNIENNGAPWKYAQLDRANWTQQQ
ncbi:4Fe-4S dicluster domain-containing protein [Sphingobacterium sp. UGAL515B_05]|uniref:4Fe-4S dicluster domain-containing protein n=1 Tax=Sphingobacterium sp. UGAL515B_05 TaxID=2986767 RepID=UPI0029534E7F|nr:4Fe-4S dicluster domain-containing protein [Sphingobacterium sp. UGAL515B_05]WON94696.1 4Fe-4S dicluster domain-containing protein [Sphingobacterium sp. UGAL515B_05]